MWVFREEPKLFFDRIEPAVRPRSKPDASHRPPPRIRLLTRVLQTLPAATLDRFQVQFGTATTVETLVP